MQRLPKPNRSYYRSRNALIRRAVARSIRAGQTFIGRVHILDVAANHDPDIANDATSMFRRWEKRSGLPYYALPGGLSIMHYPNDYSRHDFPRGATKGGA